MNRILLALFIVFLSISASSQTNVSIVVSQSSMAENGSIDIIASLDAVGDEDVSIDFEFSGTAKAGLDYTSDFFSKGTGATVAGGNGYGSNPNQLGQPTGVFVDLDGNMYIAEHDVDRVSKWLPGALEGIVVAGGNGGGSAANQLDRPNNIFVDLNGNIYVVERANHRVSKWLPGANEGIIVAGGNGVGSATNQLDTPFGVFVDLDGNVYVSDAGNNRIQKWAPGADDGTTVAGGNGEGSAANQLYSPSGFFVDLDGNIYVADYVNHRVQKWAPGANEGITVAGGNGEGSAASQFHYPLDVFVDLEGNIYVADFYNYRIQKWAADAAEGITVAGNGQGSASDQIQTAHGVYVDLDGNIYVADRDNQRVQRFQYAPQIVIPAGETVGKLSINGIEDEVYDEVDETIIVDVKSVTNASVVGDQQVILTIVNTIVSTTSGGNWSETSTWVGGVIPTSTDNVEINATVIVDTYPAECKDFTIHENGQITRDSQTRSLTVHGNMTNNGSTEGSPFFTIYIKGDLIANGTWSSDTNLSGASDQSILILNYSAFNTLDFDAVLEGSSYQWYKDGEAITGDFPGATISGQTSKILHMFIGDNRIEGVYKCIVDGSDSRTITIGEASEEEGESILAENFDGTVFPPNGWVQTITNSSNTWAQGNLSNNLFTDIDATNVYSALCPWVAEDQDEWLKSPEFSLSDGVFTLEFYAGYSTAFLAYATMKLHISIDGGSNWTNIWEALDDDDGWKWRLISLDLSTYANNANVKLAWQYVGNDGDWVGIDNVNLVSGTIGIDDIPLAELKFASSNYPNPFALQTTISLQLENRADIELFIYNSLGQKVEELFQGNLDTGNHQFNFNAQGLKSGVYYYRFIVDGISVTKPLLVSN